MFCRYFNDRNTIQGNFDRHDFAPKLTPAENMVWGDAEIRGTFQNMFARMLSGLQYRTDIYDWDIDRLKTKDRIFKSGETINGENALIENGDSQELVNRVNEAIDAVITDPPYAGNVNYSELADFYYVWLRLILKNSYPSFLREYTPKGQEIVENRTRGISNSDFRDRLQNVFESCLKKLKPNGVCAFTYHHSEDEQWVDLCDAINKAGFVIESVYPIHGEKESSLNLMDTEGISYDLIHVCRVCEGATISNRSWQVSVKKFVNELVRSKSYRIWKIWQRTLERIGYQYSPYRQMFRVIQQALRCCCNIIMINPFHFAKRWKK